MKTTKILSSALLGLALVACASEPPRPKASVSFVWSLPNVETPLSRPNFEYVKFGVVGTADMEPIAKKMFKKEQIGLVNAALKELFDQVPMEGGSYGLVNVITDVSTTRTYRIVQDNNGRRESLTKEVPNKLVIRADVVRFKPVNLENAPLPGQVGGIITNTPEGQALLADAVVGQLKARGTL